MTDIVKFNVRLPKPLHRRLQRDAAKNNVSMNTQMVNELEGSRAALVRDLVEAARPELKDIAAERHSNVEHAFRAIQVRLGAIEDRLAAVERRIVCLPIEPGESFRLPEAEFSVETETAPEKPSVKQAAEVTAFDPAREPANPSRLRHYDAPRNRRDKSA